jgi:ParB-like nuclease domain
MTVTRDTEKINTKIITISPFELKLLELNARYMRHETFQQLVQNIRRDGKLTQLPFAVLDDNGDWEVISGNHRVKAAREAGLDEIEVLVTEDKLSEDRKKAIQLSHNAISGEDDPAILKQIYEDIQEVDFKMYAGLDDKTLELLDEVQPESISEANLEFQTISFVFLPDELEVLKKQWEVIENYLSGDEQYLARFKEYDKFLDNLETIGASYGVKNIATTFSIMMDVVENNLDSFADGWYDSEREEIKATQSQWVPLATIFNQNKVPAKSAATIKKAVDKMLSKGDLNKEQKWEALEYWASTYLQGE